jgi:hypothetical protein
MASDGPLDSERALNLEGPPDAEVSPTAEGPLNSGEPLMIDPQLVEMEGRLRQTS